MILSKDSMRVMGADREFVMEDIDLLIENSPRREILLCSLGYGDKGFVERNCGRLNGATYKMVYANCAKCGKRISDNRYTVEFQNDTVYGYVIKRGYHVCGDCFTNMNNQVDKWGTLGYQDYIPKMMGDKCNDA